MVIYGLPYISKIETVLTIRSGANTKYRSYSERKIQVDREQIDNWVSLFLKRVSKHIITVRIFKNHNSYTLSFSWIDPFNSNPNKIRSAELQIEFYEVEQDLLLFFSNIMRHYGFYMAGGSSPYQFIMNDCNSWWIFGQVFERANLAITDVDGNRTYLK